MTKNAAVLVISTHTIAFTIDVNSWECLIHKPPFQHKTAYIRSELSDVYIFS